MTEKITYDENYYAVMANDIIKGKQSNTLQQMRFIRLMISQIEQQDKELKKFTCKIQDFADFFGIDKSNLYKDIMTFCSELIKTQTLISTGNPKKPWKAINWFGCAEYNGNGEITLCLSEQIRPYLIELNRWFTQYQLKSIVGIKSVYGIRLYEILKCDDNKALGEKYTFKYKISTLREILNCEKKYKQIKEFKEKVIEKATQEINNNTDLFVITEYIKTGRKITDIQFEIFNNRLNHKKYSQRLKTTRFPTLSKA